jgi:uncharacterized protein with PIN domain
MPLNIRNEQVNRLAEALAGVAESRANRSQISKRKPRSLLSPGYGRGRGHPAQLNLGDCFAYAAARTHTVPLLFKGDDCTKTDIEPAATA